LETNEQSRSLKVQTDSMYIKFSKCKWVK
jgi:hypothetical protein